VTQNMPGDPREMVEHLVGPAGPELGCGECFDELDTYVELELAGAAADTEMPLMHAHLRGCPACRDDHDSLLALLLTGQGNPA
jgi:hypothetical protein